MTIKELVAQIQSQKPNTLTLDDYVAWLSDLDGQIKAEVIDTHEGGDTFWMPYTPDDITAELLAKPPYDQMYYYYLESKIDYANAEYQKFNNSSAMFAQSYQEFRNAYNRTHLPIAGKMRFY